MYRVGLLHSHPLIAWAVDRALATVPDLSVSLLDANSAAPDSWCDDAYDVLITDQMPRSDGQPSGIRAPHASCVLVMSPLPEPIATETFGADGYVSEFSSPSELVRAVRQAAVAGHPPSDGRNAKVSANERPDLSKREQQVLNFIADGLTHAQVARRLAISQHTVDTYVKRIRSKLKVGNKAELARAALALCWAA
ncbi:LuxR family transcriptional regulator [Streptomyces sp. NBC_00893]|uniref:response regulator transcription factor n=1 Tax=Streptomyces sp. NBC_00893 TaxID=2975862 RepID=UPI002259DB9D|nr:response regulator transcription factor [Streptomyces sp. NBC_00893]MCX4846798.1 response regulator transcription factor [Streptomyces sp. NBC_00893]